jgi:hypothetical protein
MIEKVNPVANLFLATEFTQASPSDATANQAAGANKPGNSNNTLSEFAGKYHSDELSTDYGIQVKDGKLVMTHTRLKDMELKPSGKDEFSGENDFAFTIKFLRERQKVSGFEISNFGVQNLRFVQER